MRVDLSPLLSRERIHVMKTLINSKQKDKATTSVCMINRKYRFNLCGI